MLFFFFSLVLSAKDEFWEGSPLFLNITVIFAIALLIASVIYFSIKHQIHKKKKQEALLDKAIITNQNHYFNPNDDTDPLRPMAILILPIDGTLNVAGNVELLEKLPHVPRVVTAPLKEKPKIDLFAPE